jgi:hypothetical protein
MTSFLEAFSLTPSMLSRILDMWDSGTGTYDIAKSIGCHESEVYNMLARLAGETEEATAFKRRGRV